MTASKTLVSLKLKQKQSTKAFRNVCRGGLVVYCTLLLCILCGLVCGPRKAEAWITLDGGENVTLHGNTNVGPPDTLEKYDLNVYGDVRVGRAESVDPFATTPSMLVEGAVTASRIVLKDSGSFGSDALATIDGDGTNADD